MRCIEIGLNYDKDIQETGLTLTWDVLKWHIWFLYTADPTD